MKKNRRDFIKLSAVGSAGLLLSSCQDSGLEEKNESQPENNAATATVVKPIVLSTWNHGVEANQTAFNELQNGATALDAVEKGVKVCEADPTNMTVGLGGLPDRDGKVTLDACIMDHKSNAGAVSFLQHIQHPISVARKVMEDTEHVMLSGQGALEFALESGFEKTDLLTDASKERWEEWLVESKYQPIINIENHDTIGMIALDEYGNLSGACTTSGLAYKMHGRVGDSPIIGAGLFIDNEVGAACATGVGEAVIKVAGSAMVVELMRHGHTPEEACKEVVNRIISKNENIDNMQVGFIALNKNGEYAGYSVYEGFEIAVNHPELTELQKTGFHRKWN